MKSSLLIISCCVLLGAALGWIIRGQADGASGRDRLVAADGSDSSANGGGYNARGGKSGSANGGNSSAKGAANFGGPGGKPEIPTDAARRLMKEMMAGGLEGGPPAEFFDFIQAIAACDKATLNSLLDDVLALAQGGKDKKGRGRERGTEMLEMIILARLGTLDPEAALDRMIEIRKSTGSSMDQEIMMSVLGAAAKADPARVEGMIARMPDEEMKKSAKMAYMMVRARQDPEGVLGELAEIAKSNPEGKDRMFWETRNIIRNVSANAPDKAIELAAKFENSLLVKELMQTWESRDPQAAAKWAAELNDPAALKSCLDFNPEMMNADSIRQRFASLDGANPDAKARLAESLAGNLAATDLIAAVAWAQTLSGADQAAANGRIGRALVDKDPVAASEWITALPQGAGRDEAVTHLVNKISGDDPEGAFAWATSLHGLARFNTIGRALQAMNAKDPTSAERAINTLPEGERTPARRAMEDQARNDANVRLKN